jgi:hypothetical protein
MIKLFSLKNQKKGADAAETVSGAKRSSAAHLRITKGTVTISEFCPMRVNPS